MANALEYLEQPNTTSEATVAVAGEDTVGTLQITDDIDVLLDVLPVRIREALRQEARLTDLIEVVMDLGRLPEARFMEGDVYLSEHEVTQDDLFFGKPASFSRISLPPFRRRGFLHQTINLLLDLLTEAGRHEAQRLTQRSLGHLCEIVP